MYRQQEGQRARRGFTLIELLVVISIVALLSSLAYPAIQHAIALGKRTRCAEHLRQLGQVIVAQSLEPDGFPYKKGATGAETLALLYERGVIGEEELFTCPAAGDRCTDLESIRSECSYAFRVGARSLPMGAKAVPIACDDCVEHHGNGLNVLYSDGRVVFEKLTELPPGLSD
jgi:prepilin-type N-terminal cleavage/methylation domain-containing protein/prepilin-type processing-associated H-X9-DG protein